MSRTLNLSETERWASALTGVAWIIYGARQRSLPGVLFAASGSALVLRGASGFCPAYAALGIGCGHQQDTRQALAGSGGVHVDQSVTIARSPEEIYAFWRDLENLPRFMSQLVSVTERDRSQSHWVARAPAGRTVEWDAEIIHDTPNELISWRTVGEPDVISAGSVRFTPVRSDETRVQVRLQYDPPAGHVGATVAWLFGQEPSQTVREDLRRFKSLMEAGEIPTTTGQPRGRQSILNYR